MSRQRLAVAKRRWRQRLDTPWLRTPARWGLSAAIAVTVVWARVADLLFDRDRQSLPEGRVTVIVKTFERPRQVRRLVRSIRRIHPELRVLVVDDSRSPKPIDGAELIAMPYNSGISAGRNAALAMVETPYAVFLDDDFVFDRRTRLNLPLAWMDAHPDVDILGGRVLNLPDWSTGDYANAPLFPGAAAPVKPAGSRVGGLEVYAKVPNFLLVRADRVALVGWSEELKVLEHRDFFTRASGVLVTVHDPKWRVLHARNPFDRADPIRQENQGSAERFLWQRYIGDRQVP